MLQLLLKSLAPCCCDREHAEVQAEEENLNPRSMGMEDWTGDAIKADEEPEKEPLHCYVPDECRFENEMWVANSREREWTLCLVVGDASSMFWMHC